MQKYSYEGPVMNFDRCYISNWRGETTASSEKKARSNLIYRCKREHGLAVNARLSLPGKLKLS
mgnify:FL=1